jgi:hypothetical protein
MDTCCGGHGSLRHVLEFAGDAGAEQIPGTDNDAEDQGSGYRESEGLGQREPAHERLRAEPQQHGEDDRAEGHENDAEQIPDENGKDGDRDENERPLQELEIAHLHARPASLGAVNPAVGTQATL